MATQNRISGDYISLRGTTRQTVLVGDKTVVKYTNTDTYHNALETANEILSSKQLASPSISPDEYMVALSYANKRSISEKYVSTGNDDTFNLKVRRSDILGTITVYINGSLLSANEYDITYDGQDVYVHFLKLVEIDGVATLYPYVLPSGTLVRFKYSIKQVSEANASVMALVMCDVAKMQNRNVMDVIDSMESNGMMFQFQAYMLMNLLRPLTSQMSVLIPQRIEDSYKQRLLVP